MNVLEINLTGYDSDENARYSYYHRNTHVPEYMLARSDEGRRAAKDSGITRQCDKVDEIEIHIPDRVTAFKQDFLQLFLGPAARKLGPQVLEHKLFLVCRGRRLEVEVNLDRMCQDVRGYLRVEERKIAERAEKKEAKKPDNIVWGEPTGLFVPDIGTRLKLVLPWNFEIHRERRNEHFLKWIHDDPNFNPWGYRNRDGQENKWPVTMQRGSIIICDRVYIRQGKGFEDFSSITFRLVKGAEVVYNGTTLTAKRNYRFWAKLRHVNQLMVEVDLNSLPGQEKDGTARK